MTPLRVVLADDQALIRAGFRAFLEARDIRGVAEAADGFEAIEAVKRSRPDVVLMESGCRRSTVSRRPAGFPASAS